MPIDPLFCHPETGAGGASAYGAPLFYEVSLPGSERASVITVRFTELPVAEWRTWTPEQKRAHGIVGGAGVSFMRAGREIDYGWRLFGGKRRENYDDWWRCEVSFEPSLDEYFGVTHSKQGVSPTPSLRSILESDLEATARVLNARVRAAFESTKRSTRNEAATRATRQDHLLAPIAAKGKWPGRRNGLSYAIALGGIPGRDFFRVTEERGKVQVTINTDHPFYECLYAPAAADHTGAQRYAIDCLLLAAGRASLAVSRAASRDWAAKYREEWSDALAAFLETKGAHS